MKLDLHDDKFLTIMTLAAAVFIYLALSQDVGTIYSILVLAYFVIIESGSIIRPPQVNNLNVPVSSAFIFGIMLFSGWYALGTAAQWVTGISNTSTMSILDVMFAVVNTRILATDPSTMFFTWTFLITLVESMLVAVFILGYGNFFLKVPSSRLFYNGFSLDLSNKDTQKKIWTCLLVGATISLIHFTTRVTNPELGSPMLVNFVLVMDALFFAIMAFGMMKQGDMKAIWIAHIIPNGLFMAHFLGWI